LNESNNNNDYVSLVRIPRKWFYIFVWTFSTLTIANIVFDICFGWASQALGETPLTRTSVLMTLIVGWFFILSHLLEGIMLGYAKLFRDKVYAEGKAEGKTEGIAQGKKELFDELREAQRKGIPLEKVLENYNTENSNKVDDSPTGNQNNH
jgi:hypothetical protein